MNERKYAIKNALLYTALVSVILLAPLLFYLIYMKNLHSIQNELFLKQKMYLIINSMQEFNQHDEYFAYPRFKNVQSGLYDKSFQAIFTVIEGKVNNFKEGYYQDANDATLVTKLPKDRYFHAQYLIVKNRISYATVYKRTMFILGVIVILIFLLSLFFLKHFSRPFQEINKQLDKFIKNSIHEINTPLAIMNVNIDLYNRKNTNNKYMQRVKAASKLISNIYNDMEYLVKHDKIKYKIETIYFTEFISKRIEYFTEVASIKNITIESDIKDNIIIYMNSQQLRMLIDNNISNAIKYSHEQGIISVSLVAKGDDFHLIFRDNGVGIEDTNKIFKRYYRESTKKGGFGIGLNIVNSIMQEYNIDVTIQSQLGKGSTFIYIFPLELFI